MSVTAVRFTLARQEAEAFADALMEFDSLSVSVEDAQAGTSQEKPIFGEPGADAGLWELCDVVAHFAPGANIAAAMNACAEALALPVPQYTVEVLEDIDWVRANQAQFQPICISDRVWIVPSWHAHEPLPAGALPIQIDPGAAFGTGSHPTTRLCLRWLESTLRDRPNASVIDYGCGSGILAIAALKLGAASATGVDIDEQALVTARHNADVNSVRADFLSASERQPEPADLVVANILSHPLIVLAPFLSRCVRPGGALALSGILGDQAEEVIAAYAPWIPLRVAARDEDWVCLSGNLAG
ncbi:MAG: 50S ribosomal protein L11 methyltransferase [Burkholderiales bacterium]|nr:50S ribosomal protein L11 methyltransferase [Burkholderiales bacterium]